MHEIVIYHIAEILEVLNFLQFSRIDFQPLKI